MFKQFKIVTVLAIIWSIESQACLQMIAIPAKDFCQGNSLFLITCDSEGKEQILGSVSCDESKTQYTQEDITPHNIALVSIQEQSQAIVVNVQQNQIASNDDEALIYLYFEVDTNLHILRVLVIKNNLLADNPFDVIEYLPSQLSQDDDDDDFFGGLEDSDLANINLSDIKTSQPMNLSYYEMAVLTIHVVWAIQVEQAKQNYNKLIEWFRSKHA